jgi:hypothetical protein
MAGYEYVGNSSIDELLSNAEVHKCRELHLSVSMRSFRSELVSAFAKAIIDGDEATAKELYPKIIQVDSATNKMRYPILLTRNLQTLKNGAKYKLWHRTICKTAAGAVLLGSPRGVMV